MRDFWQLPAFQWLGTLTPAEVDRLRQHATARDFGPRDPVLVPASAPRSVYLLERGLVRIFRVAPGGAETTFGYVRPGEIFGEQSLFSDIPCESHAQAIGSCRVWQVPTDVMRDLLSVHPRIGLAVTQQVTRRLRRIESRVEHLVFRDVRTRVACILLELAEDFGATDGQRTTIDLDLTQEELGTIVGATRQRVNAALRALERQSLLSRSGRRIVLLAPEALRGQPHSEVA